MSEVTAAIAAFACAVHEPPERHAEHVARALVDTVACGLAATGTRAETLVRDWASREHAPGAATVWTTGEPLAPAGAALINGTAAHVLDWDDVSPACVLHPSAVLLPALLADAETRGADGPRLVAAYDTGAAVFRALASALPGAEHYRRGWHTTSTVGRLAAVAALASLRRLGGDATRHALGVAASQAAGSRANFGSDTKPLHAGLAARDALLAVELAAAGFTANPDELDASAGFLARYGEPAAGGAASLAAELERLRADWPRDWALKRYPSCYATHRAIDAALALRERAGGAVSGPVDVAVEPGGLRPLLERDPSTGAEARFSMAYTVATALVHGDVGLARFDDEAIVDPAVRALMASVTAHESETPPTGDASYDDGYAVVALGSGERCRVERTRGDASLPLADDELDRKLGESCAAAGLPAAAAGRLADGLRALPREGLAAGGLALLLGR